MLFLHFSVTYQMQGKDYRQIKEVRSKYKENCVQF